MTIALPWRRGAFPGKNQLEGNMIAFWQNLPPDYRWLILGVFAGLFSIIGLLVLNARAKGAAPADPPLMMLTPKDAFTVHQAYEGVFAVGVTGSGKTSTLVHLMEAYMKRKAGMLILTASVDDFNQVFRLAKECGRESDVCRFAPGEPHRFDFLNFELSSPGGSVATASQLMQDVVDFSTRTQSQSAPDPFWPLASSEQIKAGITIVYHATGQCSVADLFSLVTSMPATKPEITTPEFANSFCGKCLRAAAANGTNSDVDLAADYILEGWPRMGARQQRVAVGQTPSEHWQDRRGGLRR
jgi:hypothetical protein